MSEPLTCAICGESETDQSLLSYCSSCDVLYHLNPRSDREGKDCGDVRAGMTEFPPLEFLCNNCLEGGGAAQEQTVSLGSSEMGAAFPGLGAGIPGAELYGVPGTSSAPGTSDGASPPATREDGGPPRLPDRKERPRRRFRRID